MEKVERFAVASPGPARCCTPCCWPGSTLGANEQQVQPRCHPGGGNVRCARLLRRSRIRGSSTPDPASPSPPRLGKIGEGSWGRDL